MQKIDNFERAITENADNLFERGIHPSVFKAYKESHEMGVRYMNFRSLSIGEADAIAVCLKGHGIESFTVSERSTGLMDCADILERYGYFLCGVKHLHDESRGMPFLAFVFSTDWYKVQRGY